jgi:carbon storage regulator
MLVLSRERHEEICIGDDIVVAIVQILGNRVRVGVDAPPEVPVHRREVYDAIQRDGAKRPAPDTSGLLNQLKSFRLAGAATLYDVNEGRKCDPVSVDGLIALIERLERVKVAARTALDICRTEVKSIVDHSVRSPVVKAGADQFAAAWRDLKEAVEAAEAEEPGN